MGGRATRGGRSIPVRRVVSPVAEFLRTEASGGIVLLLATVLALAWANGLGKESYESVWESHIFPLGHVALDLPLREWVNEGLMTLFFLVVGLEIKRELVSGELRDPRAALLPVGAALGGMVVPALLYLGLNAGRPGEVGWAIPMATDIAFVVGLLALLGQRAPSGVRVFLLTLAIVDDIGAIVVIALLYTADLELYWLAGAVGLVLLLGSLAWSGRRLFPWSILLGLLLWYATFRSGVHATLAGVALGLLCPTRGTKGESLLPTLEHHLHPWTSYFVLPVFALANAGLVIEVSVLESAFAHAVTWGVILGLTVGKPVGIGLFSAALLLLRAARLPGDMRFVDLLGAGAVAGIGFTVSLFVAALAFPGGDLLSAAKVGIFTASPVSGAMGALLLLAFGRHRAEKEGR